MSEEVKLTAKLISELYDKIDGLESDLYEAVGVAYQRGATEWVRMNYPKWYEEFVNNLSPQ